MNFSISVKIMISLAIVRLQDFDFAVDLLVKNLDEELHNLLESFENNYIGKTNHNNCGK